MFETAAFLQHVQHEEKEMHTSLFVNIFFLRSMSLNLVGWSAFQRGPEMFRIYSDISVTFHLTLFVAVSIIRGTHGVSMNLLNSFRNSQRYVTEKNKQLIGSGRQQLSIPVVNN